MAARDREGLTVNRALLSSDDTTHATPPAFYAWLDRQFHFTRDVCATKANAKHPRFWSPAEDGLRQSWEGETAWMNPPYGRQIVDWCTKARDEAVYQRALVVLLLPARVDTRWWNTTVMQVDGKVGKLLRSGYDPRCRTWFMRWEGLITLLYFHDQRIKFEGVAEDSAPFPSAVVVHASPSRKRPVPSLEPGEIDLTLAWPR